MLSNLNNRLLAQSRPSGTSAVKAYSPDDSNSQYAEIHSIIVCNTTASPVDYSLYHDDNGTTYDATSALAFAVEIAANSTDVWEFENPIPISAIGNLAVQSSTGNAINFSIYGLEKS